jgi:hypothetical protein
LEDLGWKIHRIWSTDWFKAADREVDRVLERVRTILEEEESEANFRASESSLEFDPETAQDSPVDGPDAADPWMGEAAIQPRAASEIRDLLLQLREEIGRDCPAESSNSELLRDEMLEALMRVRPRCKEDWLRKVPLDLRLNTDGVQLQAYLNRAIALTAQLP